MPEPGQVPNPADFARPEHVEAVVAVPKSDDEPGMHAAGGLAGAVDRLLTPPATEEGDVLELRANGTTRVVLDGRQITLRRATIGEVRRLRELLSDIEGEERAELDAKRQAGEDEPLLDPDATVDRMARWVREAFKVLASHPLPDNDDDLPFWLVNPTVALSLMAHWRTVPLVRGT